MGTNEGRAAVGRVEDCVDKAEGKTWEGREQGVVTGKGSESKVQFRNAPPRSHHDYFQRPQRFQAFFHLSLEQ